MSKRQVDRIRKVTALAARAGTEGERRAAEAALDRLAAKRQRKRQRQQQRLTDAFIKRLPVPARGNRITYDSDVHGFGARVTTGGARSFILNYVTRSGRERRLTIGSCSDWRATAARAEAKRLRQVIDQGGDPLSDIEAERQAPTMVKLCDRFEAEHLPRLRASSQADYKRMIANHIRPALKHLKVADVAFEDIDRLHRRITAAGHLHRANRVIAVASKMFSLSMRWGYRTDNPAKGIERNLEHHRRRYLSGDELARLIRALAAHPDKQGANIIRILLLTGCRRGEALSMRWADVDLGEKGVWSKLPSSTKQREHHQAPLSAPARQLLSEIREEYVSKHPKKPLGEYVFPSHSAVGHVVELKRAWRQLCKAAGLKELRLHDLRHSYASQVVSGGGSLALVGALLGHSTPQTTSRYAHLHLDPMREATERVGAAILTAGQPPKEPVELKPRGADTWPGRKAAAVAAVGARAGGGTRRRLAGHHLNVLIEMWLAGVPIQVDRTSAGSSSRPSGGTRCRRRSSTCWP